MKEGNGLSSKKDLLGDNVVDSIVYYRMGLGRDSKRYVTPRARVIVLVTVVRIS